MFSLVLGSHTPRIVELGLHYTKHLVKNLYKRHMYNARLTIIHERKNKTNNKNC